MVNLLQKGRMEGGGTLCITFDNRSIAKGVEFVPLWTGRMGVDQCHAGWPIFHTESRQPGLWLFSNIRGGARGPGGREKTTGEH